MQPNVQIIKDDNTARVHYSAPDLRWIEKYARLMDSRFLIPGTKIKFGVDPILSLFPVFGDLLTYIISGVMIYTMYNHGASRKVVIKMILNSTLDTVIGAIPIVGTVFDIFYRSNDRNVRLLKEYYFEGKHQGSGRGLLILIAIVAIALVSLVIFGIWKLMEAIF
ncbi:DUF4112 domain-containing protein [Chryseosolibacter indicus]|nr:DUF4112 domain-containing protein [Chryseosolibacter indicus]